jgi:hypothetical protein
MADNQSAAIHVLKTWPEYFDAVVSGVKTFEVRRDDRGYREGDVLILQRWEPERQAYSTDATGHPEIMSKRVSYVLRGGQFGVEQGFVVMGLSNV